MRHRHTAISVATALIGLLIAATGCSSSDSDDAAATPTTATATSATSSMRHLAVPEFAETIKQSGVIILDVRTPGEFAQGYIAGAKNIDVEDSTFAQQVANLDKAATYALYCRSGNRSTVAGNMMLAAGFTNVLDLTGGITAWAAAGNPVATA